MRKHRYFFLILVAFYQLILVGCSPQPTKPTPPQATTPEQELSRLYQLAKQSRSPESERYRLQAARVLIHLQRIEEAEKIRTGIPIDRLPETLLAEYALIGAQLANLQFDGQNALAILNKYRGALSRSGSEVQIEAAKLSALAYDIEGNPIAGAVHLIEVAKLLSGPGAIENKETLWQMLMKASPEDLAEKLRTAEASITTAEGSLPTAEGSLNKAEGSPQRAEGSDESGWLQLALLAKNNQDDLDRQLAALNRWLRMRPEHPGALNLPDELRLLSTIITERPNRITLMLPLTGINGSAGRAVRDGFLAAFYSAHGRNSQTPQISIVDTGNRSNFLELYDNAVAQGSELIIGPLQKKNVQMLIRQPDLIVPTLALNYGFSEESIPNLYQFGLSAEDEARQVAQKAWQDGHRNSLVLMPDSDWGKRISDAFAQEWSALSGTLLETQYFSEEKSYSNAIQELLNIDESNRRMQRLQSFTNTKIEFTPRRRADIDFIFIAASPKQARQIKPTLAFHFAGKIPVYATSHIYSGVTSPLLDRDLDRVTFCETPWMLHSSNSLKNEIRQTWPSTANRLGRLYALGIDAYRLFPRIKQLAIIDNSRLDGMTGSLALDERGRIIRTLKWAQFAGGKVRTLN